MILIPESNFCVVTGERQPAESQKKNPKTRASSRTIPERKRSPNVERRTLNLERLNAHPHKSVVLEWAATIFQASLNFCRFIVVLPTTLCLELGKEIDHQLRT